MRVVLSVLALLCLTPPALAQEAALCPLTDDSDSCTRILACIGEKGRWLHGRAFGRGEGTLTGVISDGVTCTGTWVSQNAFGLGQADVACSDGMTVRVFFYYQDPYTGTATGRGVSNRNDPVQSWSGTHVLGYFRDNAPNDQAKMRCGEHDIPLS